MEQKRHLVANATEEAHVKHNPLVHYEYRGPKQLNQGPIRQGYNCPLNQPRAGHLKEAEDGIVTAGLWKSTTHPNNYVQTAEACSGMAELHLPAMGGAAP